MSSLKITNKIKFSSKDKIKGLVLPEILSDELAYICGVLIGDGSLYKRDKKHDYILKCVGNPKNEKDFYHSVIGPYFKKIFGFMPIIKNQDSNTTFGFVIHSKALFQYLTEVLGLPWGRKDQQVIIPLIFKNSKSLPYFIRGVFDTDGCISFKKKYKSRPYYPVITLSSKSKRLISEVANYLKGLDFKVVEIYDYKLIDKRIIKGFTVINRLELNGKENLRKWIKLINFYSPKHIRKIKKNWKE